MTTPIPPTVSVVTPTWGRHDLLLERCIPSVQAQTYPLVEHIIVSDGPDPELRQILRPDGSREHDLWFAELPEHEPSEHWGHLARLTATDLASGSLIAYCDDDDSLRPEHCARHAAALLAHPEAGFSVSRMLAHGGPHSTVIGHGRLAAGNVGSPMIVHRKEILKHGTWETASWLEDWELVAQWLAAGIKCADIHEETADVWPSRYRSGS
jgi:glycosyltransferase involved in cell wall biosynthesis